MTAEPTPTSPDVPRQVFETFLGVLAEKQVAAETIERLQHTLLEERDFSDKALKGAVMPEESLP